MERAKDFSLLIQPSPHMSEERAMVNPTLPARLELIRICQRLPIFSENIYHCCQDQESIFFFPPKANLVSFKQLSWAGPILATGSLRAPTCSHLARSCAKRLCWNKCSLCTHLPFPLQQKIPGKLSLLTNKSLRSRFPQQLLALPFLRSCLLPESSGKERTGKSIVKRENMISD